MTMRPMRLVSSALVAVGFAAALSGCVSYGNTHALLTPIGVAGYHSFKPANAPRTVPEIQLQQDRDPNRIAVTKAQQKPAADNET